VVYGRLGQTALALAQLDRALAFDPRLGAALQLRERLLREAATAPEGGAAPPAKHQE
jgi:hypothetical protein